MNGVDRNDQLMSYFPLERRSSKWTTKLFMHMYTLSIIQSAIVYNKLQIINQKKQLPLPIFIKLLGKELMNAYVDSRPAHRPAPKAVQKPSLIRLVDKTKPFHCLAPLPKTTSSKPRRECKVCRDRLPTPIPGKKKHAKETYHWCEVCEIPLCISPCFKIFHTKRDYCQD